MLKQLMKAMLAALCTLAISAGATVAEDSSDSAGDAERFLQSLHFQQGTIQLPGGVGTLTLTPSFRYLPPADAERLMVEGWNNPPDNLSLGMIVPAASSPLDDGAWGVIVTYEKDGHVKDDDADNIQYDALLKDMQQDASVESARRQKEGFSAVTLVDWAERPHYDKAQHKLYWAEELHFGDSAHNTLNYSIRVLGREGVLVLKAIARRDQLDAIKGPMQEITGFTNFNPGLRYTDFNASSDKVAEYGLAALVAGGVAAKLGLFGKLLALLIVFKKLILLGVAAFSTAIFKFFKRDKPVVTSPPDVKERDKVDLTRL